MDFLKEIVKEIGDDYTKLARDIDDTEQYVDTGSYIFNGLVSGSIFGGVSGNKITAIAGESSTGKTFFSLAVVKNFLDANPDGYCLYFDTEAIHWYYFPSGNLLVPDSQLRLIRAPDSAEFQSYQSMWPIR